MEPLPSHPHTIARRREQTIFEYRRAVAVFLSWCDKHGLSIDCAATLDDLLVEWKNMAAVSKTLFSYALAAQTIRNQ